MSKPIITNLVFQGGSVKGVAYIGSLEVLEQHMDRKEIKRVAGASAGAIIATLVALGCDTAQCKKILTEFDFEAMLDDPEDGLLTQPLVLKSIGKMTEGKPLFFSKLPVKPILPVLAHRIRTESGIYEGEYFRKWMERVIQEQVTSKTNGKYSGEQLTFAELHQLTLEYPGVFRDLFVVGANLTQGKKMVFHYDNPESHDVILSDAIRISMSIPQLYKPHHLFFKEHNHRLVDSKRDIWVDGGLYDNYPIDCFDAPQFTDTGTLSISEDGKRLYNPNTLGFRLVSKELKDNLEGRGVAPQNKLGGVLEYAKTIWKSRSCLQEERYSYKENVDRTVYIDHMNIGMLEFNLSKNQQQALVESGKSATEAYFSKYDNSSQNLFKYD